MMESDNNFKVDNLESVRLRIPHCRSLDIKPPITEINISMFQSSRIQSNSIPTTTITSEISSQSIPTAKRKGARKMIMAPNDSSVQLIQEEERVDGNKRFTYSKHYMLKVQDNFEKNWIKKEPASFDCSKANDDRNLIQSSIPYQIVGKKDLKSREKIFKMESVDNDKFSVPACQCQSVDIKPSDTSLSSLFVQSSEQLESIDNTSTASNFSSKSTPMSKTEVACKMIMAADDSSIQLFHEEEIADNNNLSLNQVSCEENLITKGPDCSGVNDSHILVHSNIDFLVSENIDVENDIAGRPISHDKCIDSCETIGQERCITLSKHGDLNANMDMPTVESPFECCKCGKTFRLRGNFDAHMRTHTGEKLFNCHVCGKVFSESEMLLHMRQHAGGKPFQCNECGKFFSGRGNLKTHLSVHTGEKRFECHECGKAFRLHIHLKTHMSVHTGEKPFECHECGKSFSVHSNLKSHMSVHTGEKRFECHECGKAFNVRSNLKTHMSVHTGEKPFECDECGKAFRLLAHLNSHMKTHSGNKPYKCHECGKTYSAIDGLDTHMKTHAPGKLFNCHVCDKAFSRPCHLNVHMRKHTGEKPFECHECGKSFSVQGNLKTHMNVHMGEKKL